MMNLQQKNLNIKSNRMPVIIHEVQKLLNISRLEAVQYISEPDQGQLCIDGMPG
jgi:hypothetical protein